MNTDIRISVEFWSHPKTVKLERRLGLEAVKSLTILWMWVARNRPDGDLEGLDSEDIEIAADWRGEAGALFESLINLRWVDEDKGTYSIHDWREHNPWVAEADDRSDASRLSKLAQVNKEAFEEVKLLGITSLSKSEYNQWKSYRKANISESPSNADKTPGESPANASGSLAPAPAPSPVPSPKNKNKKIKDLPPKSAATDCRDLVEEVQEKPPERDSEPIEAKEKSKDPEKAKKTQGYTPAFERFWSLYTQRNGKRGSKDQAFECWNRQLQGKYVKNGAAPPTERQLTAAVRAYADFCAQTTQYPQDARTWLGPGNHWREFMPDADMPNAPPGFDLRAYCTNADGEVDLKKFARTQRAMEGDDNYAEYLPECFRAPT